MTEQLSPIVDATPLRVGVVGLSAGGGWAALAHEPAIKAHPRLVLAGVVGSSPASAERTAEKYGIANHFASPEAMAESDEIDLMVVAVKVPEHRDVALAALEGDKPVLCEWPLGKSTDEARELAEAATGKRSFVMLQGRTAPATAYVRELVAEGYVGTVLSTSVLASGMAWGRPTDERNIYLHDRANGATMLSIPFGHALDAIASVLGQPALVSAVAGIRREQIPMIGSEQTVTLNADDQLAVIGRLDSGAFYSIHYRGGSNRATNFAWEINGTEGDLRITSHSGHMQYGLLTVSGAQGTEQLHELEIPERLDSFRELRGTHAHAIAHAYDVVVRDLDNGTHVAPDFAEARRLHERLDQVERATVR